MSILRLLQRRIRMSTNALPMTPTITAFERSPDRGKGLARDMRVRWALEEVGQPYEVRLVSFGEMKEPAHCMLHPFGQIPTYEEGDLALFESGRSFGIRRQHAQSGELTRTSPRASGDFFICRRTLISSGASSSL